MAFGIPLVDDEVVNPFLGRQRHVFTCGVTEVARRNEDLDLLKAQSAEALHDRASQRAQFVAIRIVIPVPYERVTMHLLEEDPSQFSITTTVFPACGSNPHPYHGKRKQHGADSVPDRAEHDYIHRGSEECAMSDEQERLHIVSVSPTHPLDGDGYSHCVLDSCMT